jgi:hypothetical protein
MEELELQLEESKFDNEDKDILIEELKIKLEGIEHQRDKEKSAKEAISKRFLVNTKSIN